jgi:pyruvate/2-oxoglutarate dehydrogenase complex dihydrolipoamide acyltransferase (E2) component
VNNIKKVTAQRLLESKLTIPHYYLTMECQVGVDTVGAWDLRKHSTGTKPGDSQCVPGVRAVSTPFDRSV